MARVRLSEIQHAAMDSVPANTDPELVCQRHGPTGAVHLGQTAEVRPDCFPRPSRAWRAANWLPVSGRLLWSSPAGGIGQVVPTIAASAAKGTASP